MKIILTVLMLLSALTLGAQSGTIRGNVFGTEDGQPISFGTVRLAVPQTGPGTGTTTLGTITDVDGFFTFTGLMPGSYRLTASYLGYDSTTVAVGLEAATEIEYLRLDLRPAGVSLTTVDVSARRERAREDVAVSRITVTGDDILRLPSTGGEPDIAQFLTVLPGVVSSGDQGGQLYIRGGSPVQNKILLDGMTIYNPFHSIGLFSVFETEAIRSAEVLTGGFNAEHGGRISAIVDIQTRDGNKRRLSGLVSGSPFQVKALLEGPIRPLGENGGSISFLVTGKRSILAETSPQLYDYAVRDNFFNVADSTASEIGLPYNYRDLYGKVTLASGNGSKLDLFGFNFTDDFTVPGLAELAWTNSGGGGSFTVVPPRSNVVIDGVISASAYDIGLREEDSGPRRSGVTNYTARLDFTYFGGADEIAYGFEFNGLNTDFEFVNPLGVTFRQEDFTSELNGYAKYKRQLGALILEPGLRVQYYASLNALSVEPRLGLKYNLSDDLRLKAAGGLYSQNLIATQKDLDIVNFFSGFLVGPEGTLFDRDGTTALDNNLQTAVHGVAGLEADAGDRITFNVEGYYKGFTRLLELNRNKLQATDPDFITLDGTAYGGDVSVEYRGDGLLLAGNYSLGFVTRDDGEQEYPTSFDRRHNVNLYGNYAFGKNGRWEAGFRFNFGSAFPFTQTQGFIDDPDLGAAPVLADVLTGNGNLTTLLSSERNGGRLSDFHRLDLNLKRSFPFGNRLRLDLTASVTNAYNRDNIFYLNRVSGERVDQLPLLPSLTAGVYW